MTPYKRSIRIIGAVFGLYAVLCATHLGEFWPFSIYPMFSSSGGKPWTRAIVREVPSNASETFLWREVALTDLPGAPFALADAGIAQNDLANYVSKTIHWDERHINGLKALFAGQNNAGENLLVMKVRGQLSPEGKVEINATPFMLISPDTARLNPDVLRPHR